MKTAIENLKKQVDAAAKYAGDGKRKELDKIFEILQAELERNILQSQRVMALLRIIMARLPGTTKAINSFLADPKISARLSHGNYTID